MEERSVFDRLIQDLTREERLSLLEKLKNSKPNNTLPLKTEEVYEEYDHVKSYHNFGFLEKIIIFFTVLFSSRDKETVIEDMSLDKLAREIEKAYPGFINYSKKIFLKGMLDAVNSLQESIFIFSHSLSNILRSNETDFVAFLVGLHFPEIEARLLKDINPWKAAEELSFDNSFHLKRQIEFRIDEILNELDVDKRKIIYREIKNLHILNSLAQFNFDKITSSFTGSDEGSEYICSFIDIRKPLQSLIDILTSLNISPSEDTLNAVFMFHNGMLPDSDNSEMLEKKLASNLEDAYETFEAIRVFNRKVPLEKILCLINRNMNYHPSQTGGAEDWFALFRRFWYRRFDVMMDKYTESEKKKKLIEESVFFLDVSKKPVLDNYRNGLWGSGLGVKFEMTAGFIKTFMNGIFLRELIKPLKLVLIDGQFYKDQNRLDYNESYKIMTETVGYMKKADSRLAVGGEYYHQIQEIKNSDESDENKISGIGQILATADREFEKIIKNFNEAVKMMINVVSGIVQGDMRGVYDTLSNLGYIGKGENKNLLSQLNDIRFRLDEALKLSHDLYDVENTTEE